MFLQRTIGNRAVGQLLYQSRIPSIGDLRVSSKAVQRFAIGNVVIEPSETYLWNPNSNESFSLRGAIASLTAGQRLPYVVAAKAPHVAIPVRALSSNTAIQLVAMDNGQVLAEFQVKLCMDKKGGSPYLTHMEVEPALKGQGVGMDMLKLCIRRFGVFRIGTEPNLQFFNPTEDRDKIELTDEGDGFIQRMLQEKVITYDYVFPMDYKEEFKKQASEGEDK